MNIFNGLCGCASFDASRDGQRQQGCIGGRSSARAGDEVNRQRQRHEGQHEVEPHAEMGPVASRDFLLSQSADARSFRARGKRVPCPRLRQKIAENSAREIRQKFATKSAHVDGDVHGQKPRPAVRYQRRSRHWPSSGLTRRYPTLCCRHRTAHTRRRRGVHFSRSVRPWRRNGQSSRERRVFDITSANPRGSHERTPAKLALAWNAAFRTRPCRRVC